jgi:hypothetical protein
VRQTRTLRAGTIKRLHVDRRVIAQNRNSGRNDPAITIQTSKGAFKAHEVRVSGPSRFVQSQKPLSCGARLWVETNAEIVYEVSE